MEDKKKIHLPKWLKQKKIKWSLILLTAMVFFGISGYFALLIGGKNVVDERLFVLDEASHIETRDGEVIARLYEENRTVIPIDKIPVYVQNAFISIEDTRFYEHSGIDFRATLRALYRDIIAMEKVEGGSTITQQLTKNLFLTHEKTWTRKFKEVMASIYLEKNVSKKQILHYYLNTIYFGENLYGIEAASKYYFNKSAQDLTVTEGAMLAALPKGPNYYDPVDHPERAKERRNLVLSEMHENGLLSSEEVVQFQRKSIGLERGTPESRPWLNSYIDLVIKEAKETYKLSEEELYKGGYRIVVSVDDDIQKISYEALKQDKYFPSSAEGVQGSFLLMDEATGEIVAAHGGREYKRGDLNRIHVKRQPGSVMKPLAVYGPALDMGDYEPYSMLVDKRLRYGEYEPKNYDNKYDESISLYESLKLSKNASAVWLMNEIGVGYAKSYLDKMGITIPDKDLSIALGGLQDGVTPLEMVKGYRTFIHDGEMVEPHTIRSIYDQKGELVSHHSAEKKQIFKPQTAWDMTRMLETVVQDGTGKSGTYKKALAGKTGSTQHTVVEGKTKDAWFVGYTPNYVGAMWMGYDKSDKNHYLNGGSSYPTKFMKEVLTKVDQVKDLQASFVKPPDVEELPTPIELPIIEDLSANVTFGRLSFLKGTLSWTPSPDDRVIYQVYRVEDGIDKKVGEVLGKGTFELDRVRLFGTDAYYVVPYNPLTQMSGKPSKIVKVSVNW